MLRWVMAIVGMIAVGMIVWRLLELQEQRHDQRTRFDDDDHDDDADDQPS